ncbi:MAG: nuclear transport factor 2 family protein [Chloroflexi bacterium]|nr:nuclear transport factor 2 family protein [Chloroflexota bacterium]
MGGMAELEARIGLLEKESEKRNTFDAIKAVKYRYWRCLDTKSWEELATCFAEDAVADYGPKIKLEGKKAILKFLQESLARFVGVHHGHDPEIELTGETTAKATWALYNYMIDKQAKGGVRVGGFYHDEYVKEDGQWRIRSTTEVNVFREFWTDGA